MRMFIVVIVIAFCSCHKEREIRFIGFVHKGDNIILHAEEKNYPNIIGSGEEDKNNICFFNKKMKLYNQEKGERLRIVIDSNNIKVLDTIIVIPTSHKQPFISFIYPSIDTKFARKIFLADEADSSFRKY